MDSQANITPTVQNNRMRPLVALRALQKLVNDPEKTDQVFVIIKAMSGNSHEQTFNRFIKTDIGKRILSEERNLLSSLTDRKNLQTHATGTLGHAYLGFVEREQITADGLVEASQLDDTVQSPTFRLFSERMRDQHDLWHVITGYGRDLSLIHI